MRGERNDGMTRRDARVGTTAARRITAGRGVAVSLVASFAFAVVVGCAAKPPPPPPPPPPAPAPAPPAPPPLAEVTLQSGLEAAWDGDFLLCSKRARTALSIAPDDVEAMELALRCANAQRALPETVAWIQSAYAARYKAPIVRFGLALAALLRGDLVEGRRELEVLAPELPVAAYHAALAAQIDDDAVAADKAAILYVKANPTDPAGRALQTEMTCARDLGRCNASLETVKATDDDESAVARRLGAALTGPVATSRARLLALARDADAVGSAAFGDAFALAAALREGSDPAAVVVRSPRSGRPEPGFGSDLARLARPMSRLPFATRVVQLASVGDASAVTMHARLSALFPQELGTWRVARRWEKTASAARKELERASFARWRAVAASALAKADESCELSAAFAWSDHGPIAHAARVRCELGLEIVRGRKLADARLASQTFGQLAVEVAIEGALLGKDAPALEALAGALAKVAPASSLSASALWAAGEASAPKKAAHTLWADALAATAFDPLLARRLLQKYVDLHDVPRARQVLASAMVEAPLDAFLCGVFGEILLHEGKPDEALPWLTKSCVSARARKEQDLLGKVLPSLSSAALKSSAAAKAAREPALRCVKGE